jgi:tetratricopeptide (TPR) repeat protein
VIPIVLSILATFNSPVDSLQALLKEKPQLEIIHELTIQYLREHRYAETFVTLAKYEELMPQQEKPYIIFTIGKTYLYHGEILPARKEFLRVVSQFPRSDMANDALEHIYLIESTRQDTLLLKRLARCLYFIEIGENNTASDSLKPLLNTRIGAFAYFYCAVNYIQLGDFPSALAALDDLNTLHPTHKIRSVPLLHAQLYMKMGEKERARHVLEDVIVSEPRSIYAARARAMLDLLNN